MPVFGLISPEKTAAKEKPPGIGRKAPGNDSVKTIVVVSVCVYLDNSASSRLAASCVSSGLPKVEKRK